MSQMQGRGCNRTNWVIVGLLGAAAGGCTPPEPAGVPFGGAVMSGPGDSTGPTSNDSHGEPGETDGSPPGDGFTGGGSGSEPIDRGLPCEVNDLLAEHCRGCHADPPKFGAPMALAAHEDFQLPTPSDPAASVAESTAVRIRDASRPMPPDGLLSDAQLQPLEAWLAAGAPRYDGSDCEDPEPPGATGPGDLPCEPDTVLLAHGDGPGDSYEVPLVDDAYVCFTFKSPYEAGDQAIAAGPVIDDDRVLHHWILYRTATPQVDGGVGPCNMPLDATFVNGWAPGGGNSIMPPEVGMELAENDEEWFILQIHYNNTAGYTDAFDRSGVAICKADPPRPNTAGILWLGSVYIGIPPGAQGYEVTGTCGSSETSSWGSPLTIVASSPHMHELGRGFRTEIHRGGEGGPVETLIDEPFSFSDQDSYPHDPPVIVQPGDALRSTCTYDNPTGSTVYFGEGTSDEMCFNFVMAYPIDQVSNRFCGILF